MATNKKFNKNHQNTIHDNSKLYLLPLVLILSILPLIMRLHNTKVPDLSMYNWAPISTGDIDIFLYYKQVFFIFCVFVMLLIIISKIIKGYKIFALPKILIPISIYCILTILSTIFSPYKSAGLFSIFDQHESVFTIIGYIICLCYCCMFVKTQEDLTFILKYLFISIMILNLLGLLQISSHDLFASDFGKKLFLPSSEWNKLDAFTMVFEKNRVYLTLFNPNYVGVYVSLVIPLILCLLITEKTLKYIFFYIVALIGMILCFIGSGSKTAIISIAINVFLIIIFFRKHILSKKKYMFPVLGIILLFVCFITISHWQTIKNIIQVQKSSYIVSDIKTDKDLEILYNGSLLKINYTVTDTNYNISITDNNNNPISYTADPSNILNITDERFSGVQLQMIKYDEKLCLQLNMNDKTWYFTNQLPDGNFHIINNYGKYDIIKKADSAIFTNYEGLASGRGYIWSRTLPILKKYILLGAGANYYTFAFPQQDYLGLKNAGFDGQLLTKPHSLFLQIAVQSGVLALLAFITYFILYIIWSFKLYWKSSFNDIYTRTGIAIFLAVIGFLISGISNDSSIGVSPVFWVLTGLGLAINHKNSQTIHP